MGKKIKMLSAGVLFLLLPYPHSAIAQEPEICPGDWNLYLPHLDRGPVSRSDKVYWNSGDFAEFSSISLHRDKVKFIREKYLSIGYPSPIASACEKYGPPFYVIENDLPEYIEEKIRKYRCTKGCMRNVSTNAVTDFKDVLIYSTDSEGFVVDCYYGFLIEIYCSEKPARYFDKAFFITPLINF